MSVSNKILLLCCSASWGSCSGSTSGFSGLAWVWWGEPSWLGVPCLSGLVLEAGGSRPSHSALRRIGSKVYIFIISVFINQVLWLDLLSALLIPQCGCLVSFCLRVDVRTWLLIGSLYELILIFFFSHNVVSSEKKVVNNLWCFIINR